MKVLDISDDNLAGQVPVHLIGLTTLQTMDINGNNLTQFPDSIPANGTIDFLAVYDNPTTGLFPSNTIRNLKVSDHLDLTSTEFTGGMPTVLGDMRKLSYLFLADTCYNAGPIPDEYQHLTNLLDLSLKHSGRAGVSSRR
jgi:Leucine-rich repeat (LRR) protein